MQCDYISQPIEQRVGGFSLQVQWSYIIQHLFVYIKETRMFK